MSEADQKDPQKPESGEPIPPATAAPAKPTPTKPAGPTPNAGRSSSAIASLALLIGLVGAAVGGYSFWQLQQYSQQQEQQEQQLGELQQSAQQTRRLAEREGELDSRLQRLERLPSADELEERRRLLSNLQRDQQRLSGRVEQVLGASREEWRLAEAEHLLRMAMLRLSAMQDVNSAEALLEESDIILREQNDPAAYGARQQLLEGLEALRSLPELDRTGLFLQLGALRGQSAQLSALAPEFEVGSEIAVGADAPRWRQWLDELTRYVRIDLDAENDVKPLLAGQSLGQVRLALSLAIEQAQWAVLNGNTEVYRQSLEQARSMLQDHFSEDNGQARGLRERIEALRDRQVAVELPDLAPALKALQGYIRKRETPSLEGEADQARQPAEQVDGEGQGL
ncbi:uroporphyrinogen-III C-methyltransferase [Stutzerimonas azotifigens]|uniref:Heme biosynthesis operon protein HemX n=1 Tax=Stutzerimonas azotifigens TaxID=291995 RepID=A0ABR5YYZ2_9GAMM|nr:uroporphyrinogen-III C-methyltransferase [Stutzerimonas azotifigens]MBA1273163.1 heme biosynthesis operon protein HemX [Stutzerimonas azotifigens]